MAKRWTDTETMDALETRMGCLAAMLSDVADALSEYPDGLRISHKGKRARPPGLSHDHITIRAEDWPSIQEIESLMREWRHRRETRPLASAA